MEHKTNSQILHEAADWIDRQGWEQGGGWPDTVPPKQGETLCLEGAIAVVLGLTWLDIRDDHEQLAQHPAYRAVFEYLGAEGMCGFRWLYSWNDQACRTREDVTVLLRAVAELEHHKESGGAEAAAAAADAGAVPF